MHPALGRRRQHHHKQHPSHRRHSTTIFLIQTPSQHHRLHLHHNHHHHHNHNRQHRGKYAVGGSNLIAAVAALQLIDAIWLCNLSVRCNRCIFGCTAALVAGLRLGDDSLVSELLTLDATRKRGCTVAWVAWLRACSSRARDTIHGLA